MLIKQSNSTVPFHSSIGALAHLAGYIFSNIFTQKCLNVLRAIFALKYKLAITGDRTFSAQFTKHKLMDMILVSVHSALADVITFDKCL